MGENECAFCIDMHAIDTVHAGESHERLHLLAAWREATCFSDQERAALAVTGAMTTLSSGDVDDDTWDEARRHFTETELAGLVWVISVFNAWNRIAVTTRMKPGHY